MFKVALVFAAVENERLERIVHLLRRKYAISICIAFILPKKG
jgi:hypothetical protein